VPEGKQVKNRVHLDVRTTGRRGQPIDARRDPVDAEAKRLVTAGATHLHTVEDESDYFAVMRDPEGNEFCVC
jgi:predicted enzyme related to lactoylglutathione lyase